METNCIMSWYTYLPGRYPYTSINKKLYPHHRVIYCQTHNISIASIKGKVVMHTCDNPGCINPDHLKLGTYRDNVQDMITKGRQVIADRTGEKNPRAKLTASDVAAIKFRYRTESAPTIAKDYNVSISTICRIANGAIWKSVS